MPAHELSSFLHCALQVARHLLAPLSSKFIRHEETNLAMSGMVTYFIGIQHLAKARTDI